jgi:hypothetical protein
MPGFRLASSYGTLPWFLLATGYRQLATIQEL